MGVRGRCVRWVCVVYVCCFIYFYCSFCYCDWYCFSASSHVRRLRFTQQFVFFAHCVTYKHETHAHMHARARARTPLPFLAHMGTPVKWFIVHCNPPTTHHLVGSRALLKSGDRVIRDGRVSVVASVLALRHPLCRRRCRRCRKPASKPNRSAHVQTKPQCVRHAAVKDYESYECECRYCITCSM